MFEVLDNYPFVDIIKKDNIIMLKIDIPGIKPKDIILKLESDKLTISTLGPLKKEDGEYMLLERNHQNIKRCIKLPRKIDPNSVKTSIIRGVLIVKLEISKEVSTVRTIQLI